MSKESKLSAALFSIVVVVMVIGGYRWLNGASDAPTTSISDECPPARQLDVTPLTHQPTVLRADPADGLSVPQSPLAAADSAHSFVSDMGRDKAESASNPVQFLPIPALDGPVLR